LELRRYWEIVLRYKVLIITLVLCASLGALAATYVLTETYMAGALVLVRPIDTRRVTDPPAGMREKEVLGFPLVGTDAKISTRSYAEIIQSRATAKRIVDELKLDQLPKPKERNLLKRAYKYLKKKVKELIYYTWTLMKYGRIVKADPYEALVSGIKSSISAMEIRDSHLVQVVARSDDPELAALIANSAARVFVNYWRSLYYEDKEKEVTLMESQLASNTEELNALLDTLEQYKEREGVVDLDMQMRDKISGMSLFETKHRNAEADMQELIEEREEIQRQLVGRQKISTTATIVSENPVVLDLKTLLAGLEIEIAGLKSRFTPTHPEILALQAKIDETQRRLAAEEARTVSDETSAPDPIYLSLEARREEIVTKLPALEAKRNRYKAIIDTYRKEVEELRDKLKELDQLERRVTILSDLNAEFVLEVNDVRVLAVQEPEEIRMVSSAFPPVYPSRPIKIMHVLIAAAVSLVIGIALAFLLEYVNIRIRTIEEAETSLDLPVLATIPRIRKLVEAGFPEVLMSEGTSGPS
jgi:succinoglycan biosynthesis transport protein ExoP